LGKHVTDNIWRNLQNAAGAAWRGLQTFRRYAIVSSDTHGFANFRQRDANPAQGAKRITFEACRLGDQSPCGQQDLSAIVLL
jgi:hypothetical protein